LKISFDALSLCSGPRKLDCFMATMLSRSAALRLCQAKLTALLQEHLTACEAILRCDMELKWRRGP
jgi:hypothetical protein